MKKRFIKIIAASMALSVPFVSSAQFHYDNGTLSIGTPTDPSRIILDNGITVDDDAQIELHLK